MKKILLIGGAGYIGTELNHSLRQWGYATTIVDLLWFGNFTGQDVIQKDYRDLTVEELAPFDIVVLLAAFSSPAMSVNSGVRATIKENYDNFVGLVSKLHRGQKLIYASTASLYSGLPDNATEDARILDPNNSYDISKKSCDDIMQLFPEIEYYALRLGTVSGTSANFRIDTAINSMTSAALAKGELQVYNGDVRRAFVGMHDLCEAVQRIISSEKDLRGVYNLASFNMTMAEVAEEIGHCVGADIKHVSQKEIENAMGTTLPKTYDFSIDTSKFKETFDFDFCDGLWIITKDISARNRIKNTSKRVEGKDYQ
jgi:nucleoside-diphosphate-sugar epimerase